MAVIVWALLGLTAICGTSWSYPIGVATLNTDQEIHTSESSSSSEEEVVNTVEAKLTVETIVAEVALKDAKDLTSHEEAKTITEEIEEGETLTPEGGVEHEGGKSEPPSSPPSSTEVEEGEESNMDVADS